MIIEYSALVDVLAANAKCASDDVSPRRALAIRFGESGKHRHKETVDYELANGLILYLDIDESGRVNGIEFV